MQKGVLDFLNEPGADDNFDLTIEPEIDELRRSARRRQCSGDYAVGIDNNVDGLGASLVGALCPDLVDDF